MENLLFKKLQIKPGFIIKIIDAPENSASIFDEVPQNIQLVFEDVNRFDALIAFSTSKVQLERQIQNELPWINDKTIFWIFTPKKSSKIASDLDLMKTWDELAKFDLSPCASASVNETWTALRLKFISAMKPSGLRNDHIKQNDFSQYIDVERKVVKLPERLLSALLQKQSALDYFESLSYSNKKEYVLWILTAKQEKTRAIRIEKAVEMLANQKKNPSQKA